MPARSISVLASSSPAEQVARYREDPELTERVFVHATDGLGFVSINLAVPPFDDVHVRRAVSFAIDKEAYVGMLSRLADRPADTQGEFEFIDGDVATHIAPDDARAKLARGVRSLSLRPNRGPGPRCAYPHTIATGTADAMLPHVGR